MTSTHNHKGSSSANLESLSKFLSLVLRHKPEEIGLVLDVHGWAELDQLIALARSKGTPLTLDIVLKIVETSDKKRFAVSPDGKRIRANQGHSVAVNLDLAPSEPPNTLFHGTAIRFIESIREKGLIPGLRQHVHLSFKISTAREVGSRHGKPLVLIVKASDMYRDGFEFRLSDNGVWLTSNVPPCYIDFSGKI
jgi:putative RNA 2'-phosphotransferase